MRRLSLLLILLLIPFAAAAEYKMPPKAIADVVDAPPPPSAISSPDGKWLLLGQSPALLTIEDLSRPELKLAGLRFDPERHDQSRASYATSYTLVSVADGSSRVLRGVP